MCVCVCSAHKCTQCPVWLLCHCFSHVIYLLVAISFNMFDFPTINSSQLLILTKTLVVNHCFYRCLLTNAYKCLTNRAIYVWAHKAFSISQIAIDLDTSDWRLESWHNLIAILKVSINLRCKNAFVLKFETPFIKQHHQAIELKCCY